jgi:hypothetical protein
MRPKARQLPKEKNPWRLHDAQLMPDPVHNYLQKI